MKRGGDKLSLLYWLPMTDGTLKNQGLSNVQATNHGATVNNSGKIGKCYDFAGTTSQYINTGFKESFGTGDFTITAWFKLTDSGSRTYQPIISNKATAAASVGVAIYYNHSQQKFLWSTADGTGYTEIWMANTFSYSSNLNTWHHIAMVRNSSDSKKGYFYIDGVRYELASVPPIRNVTNNTNSMFIGSIIAPTTNYMWTGSLCDIRIYDEALSPREIKEISKGLVLHYTLSGIGNPNLCIPQVSDSKWTLWSQGSSWNSINTREKVVDENGKTWCHVIQTTTSGYGGYACSPGANYNGIVIDPNKKYTISALAKTNETTIQKMVLWCHWRVAGGGGSNLAQTITTVDVTSTPKRVYATWTPTAGSTGSTVGSINLMLGTLNNISNIYFTDVKFEEGEVATPWLPNSTDPEYAAFGLNDGIEYDVSGYQNNGTKTNVVFSSDTPKYNGSSYFDGTSLIQVNPLSSEVKTISVWCKTTKNKSTSQFICQDSASGLCVTFYKGTIISHLGGSSSTGSKCTLGDSYIENGWNHFVVLKTGTHTRDVYCNGVKLTPTSNDYWSPTTGFLVGARNMSNGLPFYGYISDLRAYTTLLSEEDILALYNTPITLSSNGTLLTQGEYVEV